MSEITFASLDRQRQRGTSLSGLKRAQAGEALRLLLDTDPLVAAFRSRPTAADDPLRTPEDVLAHRDEMALAVLEGRTYAEGEYADRVPLAFQMHAAVPFLWHADMIRVSQQGALPAHVIGREQLPHPIMWWVTDRIYVPQDESEGPGMEAALIIDFADYFRVIMFNVYASGEHRAAVPPPYRYGSRFPDDFDQPEWAGVILKMLSFLNSPFIPKDTKRVSRAARRAASATGWKESEEHRVTFIDLRAAERHATGRDIGESVGVAWQHRWIVRGHHRAQWYPSIQGHKVIWVAPYIKGPEGLPLRTPFYAVVR